MQLNPLILEIITWKGLWNAQIHRGSHRNWSRTQPLWLSFAASPYSRLLLAAGFSKFQLVLPWAWESSLIMICPLPYPSLSLPLTQDSMSQDQVTETWNPLEGLAGYLVGFCLFYFICCQGKTIPLYHQDKDSLRGPFSTRLLCSGYWPWPAGKWIEPFKHVSGLVLKIYFLILMKDDGFFNHKLSLVIFKYYKCHQHRIYCARLLKRKANTLSLIGLLMMWHAG